MSNPAEPLQDPTGQIVALLLEVIQRAPGLRWIHGQGSSIAGFSDDSDIDCVVVWDQVPTNVTLPPAWAPRLDVHGHVALEQAIVASRDLDLLHVRDSLFNDWVRQVDEGNGWQSDNWPSPRYSASGLAHGTVLHDPDGLATNLQQQLQRPSPALRASTHDALTAALPIYLAELNKCADRQDHWLHQHLSSQLLKTTYTAWFVAEGHLPPFPKLLPAWHQRLGIDPRLIEFERRHWIASSLTASTSTLEALCRAVLHLRSGPE